MRIADARRIALARHPDCAYAEAYNGLSASLDLTWVVKLWRNEECYLAGDPPKYIEDGFEVRI